MPSEEERDSTYLAAEVSWGHVVVVTASLYNGVPGRRPGGSRLVVVAAVAVGFSVAAVVVGLLLGVRIYCSVDLCTTTAVVLK